MIAGTRGRRADNRRKLRADKVGAAPDWLSAAGKRAWSELVPALESAGLLAATDRGVMAAYCSALAEMEEAALEMAASGGAVPVGQKNGGQYLNPWLSVHRHARDSVMRLSRVLGIGPVARKALSIETDDSVSGNALLKYLGSG